MTVLEEIASWVSGLDAGDIPDRVLETAKHQVLSVVGASYAGSRCAGGRAVVDTVARLGDAGPCTAFPDGEVRTLQLALLQNCSLSMALDYDDYLFLGHTGHSAVLVALAVGELVGADTRTVLAAQVAANEVAGRLGGSVVLGPHNGQMWAHIHLLGAAAAASRLLGLDAGGTADAMGIAFSEPVYALFPGFMGPQSKLLTAAVPAVTGTTAAFLAEGGMTGSRVILEDEEGFWSNFSFVPLPFMLTGLGRSWVTDTIAFKPYPGCAYVDTAVDALLEILAAFKRERGRDLEAVEVRSIDVDASLLTVAMDRMSQKYLDRSKLSPTNINFSLSISLAIAVLAGRLSGAELRDGYLEENREAILAVASRVALRHDAAMTVGFMRSLDETVDLGAMLRAVDKRRVLRARHRLREHLSRVGTLSAGESVRAARELGRDDREYLRRLFLGGLGSGAYDLGSAPLEELEMPFGARVRLRLEDGTTLEAERRIPRGGPGDPNRLEVPVEKFLREAGGISSEERARAAVEIVLSFERRQLSTVAAALSAGEVVNG